jgi:hypothetical protein
VSADSCSDRIFHDLSVIFYRLSDPNLMADYTNLVEQEQASVLRAMNLSEYDDLKQRMIVNAGVLTMAGTVAIAVAAGLDAAGSFALGGLVGIIYQLMLQQGVDGLTLNGDGRDHQVAGSEAEADMTSSSKTVGTDGIANSGSASTSAPFVISTHANMGSLLKRVAGNPAIRLGFVTAVSLLAVSSLHAPGWQQLQQGMQWNIPPYLARLITHEFNLCISLIAVISCDGFQCMVRSLPKDGAQKLLFGLIGFFTYKV